MPYPNSADSEAARLAALHLLGVLDTPPVPALDALVKAASLVCGVPIALLSLLDQDRQWFKANHGLPDMTQTPRDVAFCDHTIRGDELLEVRDATLDLRFADNPLVTSQPGIRFYAGVPLRNADGPVIGTLCLMDKAPRTLDDSEMQLLASLADEVMALLEHAREATAGNVSPQRMGGDAGTAPQPAEPGLGPLPASPAPA